MKKYLQIHQAKSEWILQFLNECYFIPTANSSTEYHKSKVLGFWGKRDYDVLGQSIRIDDNEKDGDT